MHYKEKFHGMHYKDKVSWHALQGQSSLTSCPFGGAHSKKKGEGIESRRMQMPNLHLDSSAPRKEILTKDCKSDPIGGYGSFLAYERILSSIC